MGNVDVEKACAMLQNGLVLRLSLGGEASDRIAAALVKGVLERALGAPTSAL